MKLKALILTIALIVICVLITVNARGEGFVPKDYPVFIDLIEVSPYLHPGDGGDYSVNGTWHKESPKGLHRWVMYESYSKLYFSHKMKYPAVFYLNVSGQDFAKVWFSEGPSQREPLELNQSPFIRSYAIDNRMENMDINIGYTIRNVSEDPELMIYWTLHCVLDDQPPVAATTEPTTVPSKATGFAVTGAISVLLTLFIGGRRRAG